MAQAEAPAPRPRRRLPLVIALALAPLAGGGAFYAVWSGLVPLPGGGGPGREAAAMPAVEFVPLDPIIVSLAAGARIRHLRFSAQLEVERGRAAEVRALLPRILDVLNGYLRAVEPAEIEDPAALLRLRAQMMRRIAMVVGEGRVRDLLVTEFVVN